MARFTYTKTVIHYRFEQPAMITELEFISYKQMLSLDPSIDLRFEPKPNIARNILAYSLFTALLPVMIMTGEADSELNRLKAKREEKKYFDQLRDNIIKSQNYYSFKAKYVREYT